MLTTSDFCKLAYKFAFGNNITINEVLRANLKAPKDWLRGFLKSHPNLSVRRPEATSFVRVTAFNRYTIRRFFSNLTSICWKYSSTKFIIQMRQV